MSAHTLEPEQVQAVGARLAAGRAALGAALRDTPVATEGGPEYVAGLSDLVDDAVSRLVELAAARVQADRGERAAAVLDQIAVVAVGGYGRRELCPASDVDLLFLLPPEAADDEAARSAVASFVDLVLYGLWDLKLEVGHAVRTLAECMQVAGEDVSAKTSLVDARPVRRRGRASSTAGRSMFDALRAAVDRELLSGRGAQQFIEEKLEEAARRDARFGDTIYRLEPEVKNGAGGLRELHTALWIARARWRVRTPAELLRIGVLSNREERALSRAHAFLLRVRIELHLAARRRREGLGFEHQEAIAGILGMGAGSGARAVKRATERFMRAYYFHAQQHRLIAQQIVERATSHPMRRPARLAVAPGGFRTFGGMLTVADREQLVREPHLLISLFRVAQEESLAIYSYTKDLARGALAALGPAVRRDRRAVGDFLAILEHPRDHQALQWMHDLGVLRRFIPELGRIQARWQHSLYHVYTVDAHSLFVVGHLKRLRNGEYSAELPEATRRFIELPRPQVVYMAGLLHDVGKGWRSGDHSQRGEQVARAVGARFEAAGAASWGPEETEDLAWLVREHLLMSDLSQRRDLDDPELIAGLAAQCGTNERLSMLLVLTVADMKGTSPKVWTTWKSALLLELFDKTRHHLAGEAASPRRADLAAHVAARRARVVEEVMAEADRLGRARPPRARLEQFLRSAPDRYVLAVARRRILRHLEGWQRVSRRGGAWMRVEQRPSERATELTVLLPDRPGRLAELAGLMAAHDLGILSAQIFSVDLEDGRRAALDVLWLADGSGGPADAAERWAAVRADLEALAEGRLDVEARLLRRTGESRLTQRPRPHVETKVKIAREDSRSETVVDVFGPDHVGALHAIARALTEQGLSISLAKISTQGDRLADGFYVTDAETGQRIESEDRLAAITEAVRAAVAASYARVRGGEP